MQLISGQKISMSQLIQMDTRFSIRIQFQAPFELDLSSFGLGINDKLYHDDYMTFYNQPQTPQHEVEYRQQGTTHIFQIDLEKMNTNQIPRFVICATVSHDSSLMKNIQQGQVELLNQQGQVVAHYGLNAEYFDQEKAVMLTEIYFKNDVWKIAAIGQGFNGGLKALVEHFGGEVEKPDTTQLPHTSHSASNQVLVSPIDLRKKVILEKVEKDAPHLIELTKKSIISLEKNNLFNVKARVALILDYSGSMNQQYKSGDVQRVLDRIMPLALNFDDDGSFECWAFAQKPLRLTNINLNNLNDYIETEKGGYKNWQAGARYNNEPDVLEQVVQYFTQQSPSADPVYVVFISDGGITETGKIKKILKAASTQPIFWQFVGIGGQHYGVLEKLDNMSGRVVDNCNFFAMDNIQSMPDSQLYDCLLREFPFWLIEAKNKNILRG